MQTRRRIIEALEGDELTMIAHIRFRRTYATLTAAVTSVVALALGGQAPACEGSGVEADAGGVAGWLVELANAQNRGNNGTTSIPATFLRVTVSL